MNKQEIYQQINEFNNRPSNPSVANSKTYQESYLYVPENIAADRAEFFKWIKEHDAEFQSKGLDGASVVDLAFGSGNLTTHLVLDNDLNYSKIYYNDKIPEKTNQNITTNFPNTQITNFDFLNPTLFNIPDQADIVVFNPQIGGSYTDGKVSFESFTPILFEGTFEQYLQSEGIEIPQLTVNIDNTNRSIRVHSDEMSATNMDSILKDKKIFNYYDIFYQSKKSNERGNVSNNVKFRRTFDKVFNPSGILVFYGDKSYFDALFADFDYVVEYWANDEGNHLFVATKGSGEKARKCYERSEGTFIEIPDCNKQKRQTRQEGDLNEIEKEISEAMQQLTMSISNKNIFERPNAIEPDNIEPDNIEPDNIEPDNIEPDNIEPIKIDSTADGNLDFEYKNILLKGVPGTGKSRLINESFIKKQLGLQPNHKNVLRVNIHSASSNADLMQGIGITTNQNHQVEYREKQGLILHHLEQAILHPYQPFVIVLEEIQENSLNELIGDLIYLIEDDKRVDIRKKTKGLADSYSRRSDLIDALTSNGDVHFVEIPYLVSTHTAYKKMVMPVNLYFFCTSNYRDDKKVIEDNLLRRFEVIEVFPKNKKSIQDAFLNQEVSDFLEALNNAIIEQFKEKEIHPDRFMIGHAIWLEVNDEIGFCRALLKVVTEFKDVKEIEYSEFKPILKKVKDKMPFGLNDADELSGSYRKIIGFLQNKIYKDILDV